MFHIYLVTVIALLDYSFCQTLSSGNQQCKTVGGPDPFQQCIFPFKWNGKTFYGCPIDPDDRSKTWCSTRVDRNGNHITGRKKYGFCNEACPKHSVAPKSDGCKDICTFEYDPVCGTDGKTYSNSCDLRVTACKTNKNLKEAYQGECKELATITYQCDDCCFQLNSQNCLKVRPICTGCTNRPIQQGAPCIDDLKWVDTKYGDGKSRCPDMTKEWCQNHGDYSLEAKRACPNTCGACQAQRPFPTYVVGRPFTVDGISRTTKSKASAKIDLGDSNSWKIDLLPSVSENNASYNHEVGLYWLQQAEAEHASVASFARHTLQLMSIGAPSELLIASQAASIDEIKHAKMCYGFASIFMSTDIAPQALDVDGSLGELDLKNIIQSVIQEGCIEETLSAIEAHFRAHHSTDIDVKKVLNEIAADETRHAQLAWDTIFWITKKYPEYQDFVKKSFLENFEQQRHLIENEEILQPSNECSDLRKDVYLQGFGILLHKDQEKVRHAGIQNIIKPLYNAGFDKFSFISDRITNFDIALI